jgi:hypothetical protein
MLCTEWLAATVRARHAVLVAAAMFLVGCGGGGGGSGSGNNTPGVGAIQASLSAIDYGNKLIGTTTRRTFTITNTGTASFNVGNTNPGAGFTVIRPCNNLAPNASCTITVEFSPTEQRIYSGSFSVGAQGISATINLSGGGNGLDTQISRVTTSCPNPTVTVRVRVSDSNGDPTLNLLESNFTVKVGGNTVTPLSFVVVGIDEPASVGLMIDWSNSLRDYRQDLIDGSEIFINALRDVDRAGLFRFALDLDGNVVNFVDTDNAGKQALIDGLFSSYSGSLNPTFIRDNLVEVLDLIRDESNENRIVVLITDGRRDQSTLTLNQVIERANADNVAVFTIAFGDFGPAEAEWLEQLAERTGGRFFESPDLDDLADIYAAIRSLLSNQYELTFTNPSPGTSRLLEIAVVDDSGNRGDDARQIAACE